MDTPQKLFKKEKVKKFPLFKSFEGFKGNFSKSSP